VRAGSLVTPAAGPPVQIQLRAKVSYLEPHSGQCVLRPTDLREIRAQGEGESVHKVIEYREHAAECRELAKRMTGRDNAAQLLQIAEGWERLAAEREYQLGKHSMVPPPPAADRPSRYSSH
jgi:hypothetical protein